jgi:diacylglycerol kinase (ATP)
MADKKKIEFIVNPISGTQSKKQIVSLIERELDTSRYDFAFRETEYAGHAAILAKDAAEQHIDIVTAIGGDGTVNEVARSLTHTDSALAIIPCGSGNGLARHLQISMEPRAAIEVLNRGVVKKLDYGTINEQPFFCTCGVGFDAFVSYKFANSTKRGMLTYLENALREILKYKPETYELEDEAGEYKYKAFLIACANASQYGNNAYIAPNASMSDGLMDVTIMEPFTMIEAPQIAFQLFNKLIDKNSRIKTFQCKRLTIHRKEQGVIHYDGEPLMTGRDMEVILREKGLNVVINDQATERPAGMLPMFDDFFDDLVTMRSDIARTNKKILSLNKELLHKLTPNKS